MSVWDELERGDWSILVRYRAGWTWNQIAEDLKTTNNKIRFAVKRARLAGAITEQDRPIHFRDRRKSPRCNVCGEIGHNRLDHLVFVDGRGLVMDTDLGRCTCGLLLPCDSCLPTNVTEISSKTSNWD